MDTGNTGAVPCKKCNMNRLPKSNELPLYSKIDVSAVTTLGCAPPGKLERKIAVARQEISHYVSVIGTSLTQVQKVYNTGVAHTQNAYNYITEEENIFPRTMAIASGGILGLLMAARRGVIRKLFYSSTGVGVLLIACYPSESQAIFSNGSHRIINAVKNYSESKGVNIPSQANGKNILSLPFNYETVTEAVKNWGGKIYPSGKVNNVIEKTGDLGQSNPKDSDLYTTRS